MISVIRRYYNQIGTCIFCESLHVLLFLMWLYLSHIGAHPSLVLLHDQSMIWPASTARVPRKWFLSQPVLMLPPAGPSVYIKEKQIERPTIFVVLNTCKTRKKNHEKVDQGDKNSDRVTSAVLTLWRSSVPGHGSGLSITPSHTPNFSTLFRDVSLLVKYKTKLMDNCITCQR